MRRLLATVWNHDERRPRALLRIGLQLAVFGLFSLLTQLLFWWLHRWHGVTWLTHVAIFVAMSLVVVGTVYLGCRLLDRRPMADLGLRIDGRWALDALFGFGLGAGLIGSIGALEHQLGWASYAARASDIPLRVGVPTTVVVFTSVAVTEELLFRGYQLVNLADGLQTEKIPRGRAVIAATLISSIVFGLFHAANPHASAVATLNITFAGLLLAAGFIVRGQLAIPIGLHLSWNLFQNLLDMPVSGQGQFSYGAIVDRTASGPAWINGGAFGPEAGVTGLVAIVAGTAAILLYARAFEGRWGVHRSLLGDDGGPPAGVL